MRVVLAAQLISLMLSGCNLASQGGLPQPIQGLLATATSTPTPTPTATPLPTATPTPVPIEVVHQGQRDLRNGDWDSASLAFQQVLANSGADPSELSEAVLGLAHASLQRGDFGSARAALDSFLSDYPGDERTAQATFLRGEAKLGLSDWSGAISDFQAYLQMRPGLIDSYVYERIADAYLAENQIDQALTAYDQALAAGRPLASELFLRERVATIDRSLGNTSGAVAQYQEILSKSQNDYYRATIEFSLGQTWLEAGETDAAYNQFNHIFLTYPDSYEALSALRALIDAEIPVDQFQRGVVNFNQGQYDIAIQAFLNYISGLEDVLADDPLTHLYIAISYRRILNNEAALSELQGSIARFNSADGDAYGDLWLELADLYGAMGDLDSAYATYEQLVNDYPALPQAPEALYQAGELALANTAAGRAAGYFQQLASDYPADGRGASGLFQVGLALYQVGDYQGAAVQFEGSAALPQNDRPAAAELWRGKSLVAAGQASAASEAFSNATALEPSDYYGLRASDILAAQAPFSRDGNFAAPADPDEGRSDAETWLVQQFGLTDTPPLAEELRGDIAGDPRMVRARELWDLGLVVEAKSDFEAVRQAYQDDPLALYQLAIYFREIGLYRSSILCAVRISTLAGIDPLSAPVFLARLSYPIYFSDLIVQYADQYDLDPLFLFALIEQESLFEGFARSTAAAQGLMQIWPPTGEDIAAQLNWPNYQASDLQRPYVSVAFGTWLLSDEFSRFNGDPYAVLAAFNAGTGNALSWEEASGGDPDLYVEVISLSEPKLYVQYIYEHYDRYRALYTTP